MAGSAGKISVMALSNGYETNLISDEDIQTIKIKMGKNHRKESVWKVSGLYIDMQNREEHMFMAYQPVHSNTKSF